MPRTLIEALLASRRPLRTDASTIARKSEAEGGCGVIGLAASTPVAGRVLFQSLHQMRNRGNGKGGGIAAAGLDPHFFGARPELLQDDYLLAVAYLDASARPQVEAAFIEPTFRVDHVFPLPVRPEGEGPRLEVRPPEVCCYLVQVRPDRLKQFGKEHGLEVGHATAIADEIVYQNTYRLNRAFYSSTGEKRAFVLSHGKDLIVLKMVGYGDDVIRHYRLEDFRAHVWIGHHRYPTKGRVWHPGGAHPFIGLHEALVHNGDFANYASICAHLAQRNIQPLFLTDTEVAVLVFDLLSRTYGYSLEHTIEAMAPTTERDFALLPPERQQTYRALQTTHMHGSPDGPWFFLVAQSAPGDGAARLIGITDTSMLRPQVFALQEGDVQIGLAASEKQAIDAALQSLAREDARVWGRADRYWNARGGSHTDGGAFIFTIRRQANQPPELVCTDKFGRPIQADRTKLPPRDGASSASSRPLPASDRSPEAPLTDLSRALPSWSYRDLRRFLDDLKSGARTDSERERAVGLLTWLTDRRYATGTMKRSAILSLVDDCLNGVVEGICQSPSSRYRGLGAAERLPRIEDPATILVIDARDYPSEGERSLARTLVAMRDRGGRRFLLVGSRGQRFLANGLGPDSQGIRIDVYGSPGDYLASGIDGAEVVVHGSGQDQLGQIMKDGRLVVHGDVGQTFMYAAKGGAVFVQGNAAGRPLINAVGRPRVVINGTCLDYLAESFMAGDPLQGGGYIVLNGVTLDDEGSFQELETPYPGGNLFSLASGGAIYIRDPRGQLTEDQLNGGEFAALDAADWSLILPQLEENERLFGIQVGCLLTVDGRLLAPERVYRKIRPSGHGALMPEEAWVRRAG